MIKACLFDLDGTLLNTLASIRYYVNRNISGYGIRAVSEAETKIFVGNGARVLIENIFKDRGLDLRESDTRELFERILRTYVKEYDDEPAYLTEPYEGIVDTVNKLKSLGISLAVISNKPDPTVKSLVNKFFGNAFTIVEGASERMPLKPCAEWPLDICERLGVLPSEVMYVGDTSTDMQTARNFGAKLSVGVLWGFRDEAELVNSGADVIVSRAEELYALAIKEAQKENT